MSKSSSASGGIGATGLLGVAFVVLKLCHVIDWSWWWVACPFWAPLAILLLFLLGCAAVFVVAWLLERRS